LYVEIVLSM